MNQKRIERWQAEADLVFIGVVYSLPCNHTKSTDKYYKRKEGNPFHYQSSSKNGVLG